nr:hypothetical protein [Tanacetum cinerariifolium]
MDQSNHTFAKILILDTEKFEQWKFKIQQYLQNEHYALWEVIEFGDSYKAPAEETSKGPASKSFARKKGRTVAITMEDMQKRRNDVKARITLLLALPDEYQDDLDTMTLDDVYNHLKVYEPEVQKKSGSNSQNMAFISSSNTSSGKGKVHTASVPNASIQVSTASTDDWSYIANEEENHALVADDEVPTKFALMAKSSSSSDNEVKKEKESLDNKLTCFENASKDLHNLLGSQRLDKNKEGLRYNAVPPPPAQIYSPPKKDLSWTGLPEFVDDIVTDYRNIMSKPMIKFVKEADCPRAIKINNTKNARKSTVKYVEMYMNISKGPKVRGNQRNYNNLKSQ